MLYTRKGDGGTSGLLGTKVRLPKNSSLYSALGTLDELNSLIGVCKAVAKRNRRRHTRIVSALEAVQQNLFIVQARLAGAAKELKADAVRDAEHHIDTIEALLNGRSTFAIPGATELSGLLDFARAVSRRAEREVIGAHPHYEISDDMRCYLNRLSSLLFALARYASLRAGVHDPSPSY